MNTAQEIAEKARKVLIEVARILGWGADLNPANRLGYPIVRMPARLAGDPAHLPAKPAQAVEIFQPIERPRIPRLFGTLQPPSGVSGMLRRAAFKYSESDLRQWMILLFAGRVKRIEGMGSELMRDDVPNIFAEMSGKAAFNYNRHAAVQKPVVVPAVALLGLLLWQRSRCRSHVAHRQNPQLDRHSSNRY